MYACLRTVEPYREYWDADAEAATSIARRICETNVPPPVASKAKVAEVAAIASVLVEDYRLRSGARVVRARPGIGR